MGPLLIGQLARLCAVGTDTIRFYERHGLLPKPKRSESGYRQYDQNTVERLQFIARAKELQFTLKEIKCLISIRDKPCNVCVEMRAWADRKVEKLDLKIEELRAARKILHGLREDCLRGSPTSGCPILIALTKSLFREHVRNTPDRDLQRRTMRR